MRPAFVAATLSLGMLVTAGTGRVSAQGFPVGPVGQGYRPGLFPSGTPGLSPYLDLIRGGNRAANYFLGTIPEIERRRNAAYFGAAIQGLERRQAASEVEAEELVPALPETGHPVAFGSYAPYYQLGPGAPALTRPPQPAAGARRR
jgi:hypothetical protein